MLNKRRFQTNVAGKVRNTKLPKRKVLWSLFETISNSIHAIEEKKNTQSGKIIIRIIRYGDPSVLRTLTQVDIYPIKSIIVEDNGIGFTNENLDSFLTAESGYKIEKGAKGIGRFVALKAFEEVNYRSVYRHDENKYIERFFEFRSVDTGSFNIQEEESEQQKSGTTVELLKLREEYKKYCPRQLSDIAEKIVEHFLIYFLLDKCPYIQLIDQNGDELLVQNHYGEAFKGAIKQANFKLENYSFKLYLLRVFNTRKTHQIHYCAHDREVKYELLNNYIPDLGRRIEDEGGNSFVYHAYLSSPFFDEVVDNERTDFNIEEDEEDEEIDELSLKSIRNKALDSIENLLSAYLNRVREKKFEFYESHIYQSAPQFKTILKYHPETVRKLAPNLRGNKLDMELYKVQSDLEYEVRQLGDQVLNADNDFRNSEEYKEKYYEYIEKFNDFGKANLARYIVHRKSVIELLDRFLGMEDNEFQTEETIHKLFFPIRSESDEISYDKQNLWLIDERLAYHTYLSSDKSFRKIKVTGSNGLDRPDLLIFNDSFAFVNDDAPHMSFTIVEFKRPERAGYKADHGSTKNPVDQVLKYIRTIRENKAIDRKGKTIQFNSSNTPFYAYIILDLNSSIKEVLDDKDFKQTPDAMGYFKFHEAYNAYMEVISYSKLLKDARKRNKILFEKLGLPTS